MQLDRWDIELIRALKRPSPTYEDLAEVWAERCMMELKYVQAEYIAERMIQIVVQCELAPVEVLVNSAAPSQQWKYGLTGAPDGYWGNWIRMLASTLRNAPVAKLPGYPRAPETQETT